MVEKFRPNFLNPDVSVGPLDNNKYAGGTFTSVGNLENLPENVVEQTPKGYVIKEYVGSDRPKEMSIRLILAENTGETATSMLDVAKELNNRHQVMKKYFEQSLPDLVLPTQIIIGKDERTSRKTIYEMQPRLDPASTVNNKIDKSLWPVYRYYIQGLSKEKTGSEEALENLVIYLHNTFPQQMDLFKSQINIFIEQITKFQDTEKYFPFDSAMLTNLIFTEDGLRLIDTNAIMPIPLPPIEGVDKNEENKILKFRTNMFEKSLEILRIIESKL